MDSFVYRWTNKTLNKIYIGFHKGVENDGYICSSASEKFWNDFNNPDYVWQREILYKGTMKDCQLVESKLLNELDITSEFVYNQRNNVMFNLDDEVRNKLSEAAKRRNQNPEYIEKLRQSSRKLWEDPNHRRKVTIANTGKTVSKETKEKLREANLGKTQSSKTIAKRVEKLKGHRVSIETRQKISETRKSKSAEYAKVYKDMYGFICPFGEFGSLREYIKYAKFNNLKGFKDIIKIRKLLKDECNLEWRYLKHE